MRVKGKSKKEGKQRKRDNSGQDGKMKILKQDYTVMDK